jgi:CdiI immunity protein
MTSPEDIEDLRNFFSGYFHQDWPDEAADPAEVISLYLAEGWSAGELRRLVDEIRRFADSYTEDDELEHALFTELGSYYVPSADKIPARVWLHDLAATLTEAAGRAAAADS